MTTPNQSTASPAPRHRRALAIALVILLAAAIALLTLPELRAFRYAGEYREHALQIFCRDTPVDVVVVGTSRMARGVDAEKVAAAYEETTGESLAIVDLSKIGPSEIVWPTLLEDLTKTRPVKLIIAEYGDGRGASKSVEVVKKVGSVLSGPRMFAKIRQAESGSLGGDIITFLSMRLRFLESGALSPWTGCPRDYETAAPRDPTISRPQDKHFRKYAVDIDIDRLKPFPERLLFDPKRNQIQIDSAKAIVNYADAVGAGIVFINYNEIRSEQISAKSKAKFSDRFGADLVTWPVATDRLFKSEYLYADRTHLDEDGATVFADWLAGKIAKHLPAGS